MIKEKDQAEEMFGLAKMKKPDCEELFCLKLF